MMPALRRFPSSPMGEHTSGPVKPVPRCALGRARASQPHRKLCAIYV